MNDQFKAVSESILWSVWIDVFEEQNVRFGYHGSTRIVQTAVEMMQARQFWLIRNELMSHA